jgi:hypothetical protein
MTLLLHWMSLLFMGFVYFIYSLDILYSNDYMFVDLNIIRIISLVLIFIVFIMFLIINFSQRHSFIYVVSAPEKAIFFLCVARLVLIDSIAHAVRRCRTPAVVANVFTPFICFLCRNILSSVCDSNGYKNCCIL